MAHPTARRLGAFTLPLALVLCAASPLLAQKRAHKAPHKAVKAATAAPVASVTPKQENQFVTVEEFVKAKRPPRTAVSVEGYAVLGYRSADGSESLALVDSVDHVLNARDANGQAAAGARATIPASVLKRHPSAGWSAKGLERVLMYTGAGQAQKPLHDTVAKVRVTGLTAGGAKISPATKLEYQDDNGDWKTL